MDKRNLLRKAMAKACRADIGANRSETQCECYVEGELGQNNLFPYERTRVACRRKIYP